MVVDALGKALRVTVVNPSEGAPCQQLVMIGGMYL